VLFEKWLSFTQILKWRIFILCMAEQRAMQLVRITDSQVEKCLAKFINATWDRTVQNLVERVNRDLLELLHLEENILRTIEENPRTFYRRIALQKRSSHHIVKHFAWSIFASLSCPARLGSSISWYAINGSLFVEGFFIDAIKIHNIYAIFCLLMRHPSPGMGSITFITCLGR